MKGYDSVAFDGYVPAIECESLEQEIKDRLAEYDCNDFKNATWVKDEDNLLH